MSPPVYAVVLGVVTGALRTALLGAGIVAVREWPWRSAAPAAGPQPDCVLLPGADLANGAEAVPGAEQAVLLIEPDDSVVTMLPADGVADLLGRLLAGARAGAVAVVAGPVTDTLKAVRAGAVLGTADREQHRHLVGPALILASRSRQVHDGGVHCPVCPPAELPTGSGAGEGAVPRLDRVVRRLAGAGVRVVAVASPVVPAPGARTSAG